MPVRNMPSNVPAPPMEAIGALDDTPAGRSLPDRRHRTRGRGVPAHRRTHRPREQDYFRRPNHPGIPATASSAGDPPLQRNPSSLPPPIQQGNHSIDRVFTQSGTKADSVTLFDEIIYGQA